MPKHKMTQKILNEIQQYTLNPLVEGNPPYDARPRPFRFQSLIKGLGCGPKEIKETAEVLDSLVEEGTLKRLQKDVFIRKVS